MLKRKVNKMDFEAVCRTCLGNMSLKPIFPLPSNHKAFSKAISLVTGVKIAINDGFPQNICLVCLKRVNDAIKFKTKCRQTDQILREINHTIHKLAAMNNHIPEEALNTNKTKGNSDDTETDDDDCNTNYEIEIDYADNGTSAADNNINFKHLMEQHALRTDEKENSNETKTISLDKVKVEAPSDDDLSSDDNTPLKYLEKQCTSNEKEGENIGTNIAPGNIVKMEPMSEDDDDKPLNYLRDKSLNRRQNESSDKTDTVSMPIIKKEIESDDDLKNAHDDDSVMHRNLDNKQDSDMNVENQNDSMGLTTNTDDIKIAIEGSQNVDGQSSHIKMNVTGINETIANDDLKINYFKCLYDKDPQEPSGEIVICKICNKRISIWGIRCHLSKAHANLDPRRVKCKICDRYIMKCKMRKHILELHSTRTLCCKYCKKCVKEKSMPEHLDTACPVKLRQKHRIETGIESQDWYCKKSVKEKSMPEHLDTACPVKLRQKHRIETAAESQDWDQATARQKLAEVEAKLKRTQYEIEKAKLRKRQYDKNRREKMKSDPESLQKLREIERLKYLKKREKAQIKKVAMMNSKERTQRRRGWKRSNQTYRDQNATESGNAEASPIEEPVEQVYIEIQGVVKEESK